MARVELAKIRGNRTVESTEVVVDYDDDHGLVDLLKRMASATTSTPPKPSCTCRTAVGPGLLSFGLIVLVVAVLAYLVANLVRPEKF